MDINLLAVNVGNSRVTVGTFIAGELSSAIRVNLGDTAGLTAAITEAWAKCEGSAAEVAGASVNPLSQEAVEHAIVQTTGKPVQWVGRELDLPHSSEKRISRTKPASIAFWWWPPRTSRWKKLASSWMPAPH